jgi:hypothetical protein
MKLLRYHELKRVTDLTQKNSIGEAKSGSVDQCILLYFMEPEALLQLTQHPATCPCPRPTCLVHTCPISFHHTKQCVYAYKKTESSN